MTIYDWKNVTKQRDGFWGATTLSIMTLSITVFGITAFNIMTLCITTLGITAFSITTLSRHSA